jgi:hypothetical protein
MRVWLSPESGVGPTIKVYNPPEWDSNRKASSNFAAKGSRLCGVVDFFLAVKHAAKPYENSAV